MLRLLPSLAYHYATSFTKITELPTTTASTSCVGEKAIERACCEPSAISYNRGTTMHRWSGFSLNYRLADGLALRKRRAVDLEHRVLARVVAECCKEARVPRMPSVFYSSVADQLPESTVCIPRNSPRLTGRAPFPCFRRSTPYRTLLALYRPAASGPKRTTFHAQYHRSIVLHLHPHGSTPQRIHLPSLPLPSRDRTVQALLMEAR